MGKFKKGVPTITKANKKVSEKTIAKKKKQKRHEKKSKFKVTKNGSNLETERTAGAGVFQPVGNISKNKRKKKKLVTVNIHDTEKISGVPKNNNVAIGPSISQSENKEEGQNRRKRKHGGRIHKNKVQTTGTQEFTKKNGTIQKPAKNGKKLQSGSLNKIVNIENEKQKGKEKCKIQHKINNLSLLKEKKKKLKKKDEVAPIRVPKEHDMGKNTKKYHKLNIKQLEKILAAQQENTKRKMENAEPQSLRERMMARLKASRFRYLNETLYNNQSSESKKYFKDDPDAFKAYHEGYKQQVDQWPLNPLDKIIESIQKLPKDYVIADFGCGEARLAASVPQKVHSFDLVSLNERVTACDMAHTPLLTNGVNVAVFCLSLMGTNLNDYLAEANRVLKKDGILKIAEVESRFDQVEDFINILSEYGFKITWKDLSHNLFYFLDFKKEKDISGKKNKLPPITLKSCLYKKR